MTIRSTAFTAVVVLLCFACNSNSEHATSQAVKDVAEPERSLDSVSDFGTTDSTYQGQQNSDKEKKNQNPLPPGTVDWDKKIVKTANLNAEIKEYKTFSRHLSEKVKKYGGYISSQHQSESEYKIENTVTIKVPVDQFEDAVNDFTIDALHVNEKSVSSEDVTTQLIDGRSRLETKKQVRLRYLDLMRQAKNMEEILTVQKEINNIQEDIELVNGRINVLSHTAAMSTINFTFCQIIDASAKNADQEPRGFLYKVKTAFVNGWYWIGEIFVGLVRIWPLLITIILGIWLFRKKQMPKIKAKSDAS